MFSMFRRMICLVSLVLVLGLVGDVQADDVDWTDDGPDHLWSTPTNWATGTVPTSTDLALINLIPGPTIAANVDVVAMAVHLGNGGQTGELTMDGGTLTLDWSHIGEDDGGYGTVNMNSGTITTGDGLTVGDWGSGTLNMTGGTIRVGQTFMIAGASPTATGHVNLDGGTITAGDLVMRDDEGAVGTMDVRAGTLIINGDAVSVVQGYIDNGWITGYDGQGSLNLDYDVTNEGKTTLTATPLLNPNPSDGGNTAPGTIELSWTLPDPCVPGEAVQVDVYFTDDWAALYSFVDPAAIQVVSMQNVNSVVVQTQPKTQYYWAVDIYLGGDDPNNNPFFGPIFSFVADNIPPEVDAGADVVTWLQAGAREGNLDAAVTDIDPYTVQWTVVSEPDDPNNPDAVIADPSAEDTTITLSAIGEYILQLEASDGEYTGSDTVTINVYEDGCQAAQSLPDYVPLAGDVNGDCIFDQQDLDILNEDWLKDISLTEEWLIL